VASCADDVPLTNYSLTAGGGDDSWSKKTYKAVVSWSPPTNQHFAHICGPSIKSIDEYRCWLMTMLGNGMVY